MKKTLLLVVLMLVAVGVSAQKKTTRKTVSKSRTTAVAGSKGTLVTCYNCDGEGKLTCPDCGGDGWIGEEWKNGYTCKTCGGDGYGSGARHQATAGKGKVTCPDCKGKGKISVKTKKYATKSTPDTKEPVDLGLSVKWASCNVGASKPEQYGYYFAWGETGGCTANVKDGNSFDWLSYKWCEGFEFTKTKYCLHDSNGTVDNKTTLELADDAAHANWGGDWRMPTKAEMEELKEKCTWSRVTQNGVNGYRVTGHNGNSIFLPFAGGREDNEIYYVGSDGYYWTSSNGPADMLGYVYFLYFDSNKVKLSSGTRQVANSVRPVCP